jgi:hypothetical protein
MFSAPFQSHCRAHRHIGVGALKIRAGRILHCSITMLDCLTGWVERLRPRPPIVSSTLPMVDSARSCKAPGSFLWHVHVTRWHAHAPITGAGWKVGFGSLRASRSQPGNPAWSLAKHGERFGRRRQKPGSHAKSVSRAHEADLERRTALSRLLRRVEGRLSVSVRAAPPVSSTQARVKPRVSRPAPCAVRRSKGCGSPGWGRPACAGRSPPPHRAGLPGSRSEPAVRSGGERRAPGSLNRCRRWP